jgi:hypothetical protein
MPQEESSGLTLLSASNLLRPQYLQAKVQTLPDPREGGTLYICTVFRGSRRGETLDNATSKKKKC